jgi:DNA repair exonuclease SbcCD ATPase subunit
MKLKKLEVNAFAGINPSSPVILDFTESKFVTASGDNGVGKTSLINALLVACGQLSKDDKDYINLDSNKIDINFSFVGKDNCNYDVKVTKSSFKLMYEGVAQSEPISKMKELLGVVGTSPMDVKNKPLKEIVRWISQYSNKSADDFEKSLLKLKDGIKKSREARADANRGAKGLTEYLDNEEMFTNWEVSEKKYTKAVDVKELSGKLDEAAKISDKFLQADSKLKQLKERKTSIDEQISRLMQEAEEIDKHIVIGEKYVADNKDAGKNYDAVKKQYDNAAQESINYNKWQDIKKKKKEKDDFETLSQKADAKEKQLLQEVKELQTELLPSIKGMEIVTEDTTEEGVFKKEGLYREGKNVAQLSETEWVDTVIEIWRKFRVKIIVLDNVGTLGTKGIDRLEKLAKDGCHILAAEMDRKTKELQISYE